MRIAADENLDNDILRGLRRRFPELDIVRVQDTAMYMADDESVLGWAAEDRRVLLSHDWATMPSAFYARMAAGLNIPGVLLISPDPAHIGAVLSDLALLIAVDDPTEWESRIVYVPLR